MVWHALNVMTIIASDNDAIKNKLVGFKLDNSNMLMIVVIATIN